MPIINSLLDNDLYKFSQQAIILDKYPNVPVEYRFINRRPEGEFTQPFLDVLREEIKAMDSLSLNLDEGAFIKKSCPYFPQSYLTYLKNFRFNSDQVRVWLNNGDLYLDIKGPWVDTILYEVPLMATISELYFQLIDIDWEFDQIDQLAKVTEKSNFLRNCFFADFGTRRRRSFDAQDFAVSNFCQVSKGNFVGTSNVYFAEKYGIKPIGTMAHEWIMGVSALESLRHANRYALKIWSDYYHGNLGIALTDTFTSDAFCNDFDNYLAKLFDGVRHDSGDPIGFANKMIAHYDSLGINPTTKTIVFSDGLTAKKADKIQKELEHKVNMSFGIGTHFTNDFDGSKPLNMVIKLWKCNGIPVVKLSDVDGKIMGDPDAQKVALWTFKKRPLGDG